MALSYTFRGFLLHHRAAGLFISILLTKKFLKKKTKQKKTFLLEYEVVLLLLPQTQTFDYRRKV